MREFADIERRIERLCSPAGFEQDDARLLAELGDVLAVGYASALEADGCCRRLGQRIERLLSELDHPHISTEVHRLVQERRTTEEAAQRLRARLSVLRSLYARLSARADSA